MKKIFIKNLLIVVLGISILLIAMPAMASSYTITASSDATGIISPTGAVSVNSGANQTFIVTPNTGYAVGSITVDYTNQYTPVPTTTANVFQYTFKNVIASHVIYASFWSSALEQGAPQITSQPQSVSILPGATVTFNVTATQSSAVNGSSVPSYQWYKSIDGGNTFTSISGQNTPSYTTPVTTSSDNGTEFVCEVYNGYAYVSTNVATLTMFPYVKVQGRQLQVWNSTAGQYQPYVIRGVGYNPTPIGRYSSDWGYYASPSNPNPSNLDPNIYDDTNILNRDFSLLQAMNANTIRIWGGENNIETASNQPVSALIFENAFPLQDPTYGSDIYAWLMENNYVSGSGFVNVNYLTSSSYLNTLQQEFTDSNEGIINGEYYTILNVLRKAYYGDANPSRLPNMITSTTLAKAGSYGLKIIAGFYVGPFGSYRNSIYTLNTYRGESNDQGLKVPFDITNPYIRNDILLRFEMYVNTFKNDPNILFWSIGNENNLSFDPNLNDPNFNTTAQIQGWYSLVNQMAQAAHAIEGANYHPVAVINGDDGFKTIGNSTYGADDATFSNVDIWGINTYRGQSFYNYFVQYKSLSTKPLWISEYGIDSWRSCTAANPVNPNCDPNDPSYPAAAYAPASPYQPANDETDQASWDGGLWNEIAGNGDISIGGTVMEYSDNWWQPYDWICNNYPYNTYGNAAFCQSNHFYFGEGPGSAWSNTSALSSPDHYFNEAWFGIMGISNSSPQTQPDTMHPRQAYTTLQGEFASNAALASYLVSPVKGTSLSSSSVTFAWSLGRSTLR